MFLSTPLIVVLIFALLGLSTVASAEPAAPFAADLSALIQRQPQRHLPSPEVLAAYGFLQRKQHDAAEDAARKALLDRPGQPDALLILASLARYRGQQLRAREYFLQVQQAQPDELRALAGLLADPGLPVAVREARLKAALSEHPQSAVLHFEVGNHFAREQRWVEAQRAYFQAVALDAEDPDALFNLAVSLEHLNQGRLAREYYEKSRLTVQTRPAAVDQNVLVKALARLEGAVRP